MTSKQFQAALDAVRPRKGSETAVEGARLHLVEGVSMYRAGIDLDISQAAISRMVHRLTLPRCGSCGQVIKESK